MLLISTIDQASLRGMSRQSFHSFSLPQGSPGKWHGKVERFDYDIFARCSEHVVEHVTLAHAPP